MGDDRDGEVDGDCFQANSFQIAKDHKLTYKLKIQLDNKYKNKIRLHLNRACFSIFIIKFFAIVL